MSHSHLIVTACISSSEQQEALAKSDLQAALDAASAAKPALKSTVRKLMGGERNRQCLTDGLSASDSEFIGSVLDQLNRVYALQAG